MPTDFIVVLSAISLFRASLYRAKFAEQGREAQGGAFKKEKWDIYWLSDRRETTTINTVTAILLLEVVRFMSDWNMYDTLSEGKTWSTTSNNGPRRCDQRRGGVYLPVSGERPTA